MERIKENIKFTRSKMFLISCLVFIAGTGLASYLPVKILRLEIWWFAAAVFFLALAALIRPKPVFLLATVLSFALWRYGLSLPADAPDKIWHYNGRAVKALGYLAAPPDIRETNQKLEVATESLNFHKGGLVPVKGKILVTANLYPEYKYGDELELECELKRPEEYQGFAYDRYLARYDIYSTCYYPKAKLTGENRGNIIYAKNFWLKEKIAGIIDAGMSEPESSLARPIVFGGQQGVEAAVRQDFQKTGLTHIMAVSGFNVSILAAVVMAVLLGLGVSRKYGFYAAVALLVCYIILVGMPASAMRAGLMGFLVLWALKLGRLNKMTNSLILAAAILLVFNPKLLRDDAGFQLSFLALAGLVYIYPILEAIWQKIKLPRFKGLSDSLLITLAAQIFTLPVLAYNFSQVSLIAPLANLAVLWTLPPLTVFILAALPLSALLPGLSPALFLPSYILTRYILIAVKYLASLPFSSVGVDYLWRGWAAAYYAAIAFIVLKLRKSELLKQEINGKI